MTNKKKALLLRITDKLKVYFQMKSSPEKFYHSIRNKSLTDQEYQLDRLAKYILKAQNQKYYQNLLSILVPSLDLKIDESQFVGSGIGASSLNSFRKVKSGKELYFEKVYFNSSVDLKRIFWFQDHVSVLLNDKVKSPRILKTFKGELVTIVYFEYLELQVLSSDKKEMALIELSKALYSSTFLNGDQFEKSNVPDFISKYRSHFQYVRNIDKVKQALNLSKSDINEIESRIDATKRTLTHGDIQETNAFENSVLIDWDSFGIYPIGLEIAFLFFRLLVDGKKDDDFIGWLEKNYSSVVDKNDWEDFKMNSLYFLYVFSVGLLNKGLHPDLKKELEVNIKKII